MEHQTRHFEHRRAVREALGLMIGLTGSTGSGKTYSALRLATGIQQVVGGKIWGIDTEGGGKRMAKYSDYFDFEHVPFLPPYGPLDYIDVINQCVKEGAKILIIDSMSHEHDGEGGVLDQIDANMERMAKGGDREKYKWTAQIEPKSARKRLNRRIVNLAGSLFIILCYRAEDKTKPGAGGQAQHVGWQPVSTSNLKYEMDVRFLLTPCADGRPTIEPAEAAEKLLVKNARQFEKWMTPGVQLDEKMGQEFARWAIGAEKPTEPQQQQRDDTAEFLLAAIQRSKNINVLKGVWAEVMDAKPRLQPGSFERLEAAKNAKKKEMEVPA